MTYCLISVFYCKSTEIQYFTSLISGVVDTELHYKCKNIFDYHRNLPREHLKYWSDFSNYLEFYNLSDVYPTSLAMINQFDVFKSNFGIYPLQSFRLPGFAKNVMYTHYNKECPNFFSFPNKTDASQVFRDHIIGGLTAVLKRHVTLLDEPAAYNAKFNKQGVYTIFFCAAKLLR